MKLNEMQAQIESSYHKNFPNSRIFVNYSDKFGATITIGCYLAGDKSENSGGYWDNDMLKVVLTIHAESGRQLPEGLQADSDLPEVMELSKILAYYFRKPENKNLVYESNRFSFRKVSGNGEKLLTYLDKFFAGMRAQILTDYQSGRIHKNHEELVKIKLAQFAE